MKAEISHHGYLQEDSYTGVYLQQGTMITDRDWNALCERLKAQINGLGSKTIGTGIPKDEGLLTKFIGSGSPVGTWQATLRETGGYVAADGVLGFLSAEALKQSFKSKGEDRFGANEVKPGFFYVDIWDEVVNALQDEDLLDPGLHGAHTAFATRRRVQIKRCREDHIEVNADGRKSKKGEEIDERDPSAPCGHRLNSDNMPSIGDGEFTIKVKDPIAGPDDCDPCEDLTDTEQDLGNYLFRLEIHDVDYDKDGTPTSVTLKWSNENGAIETPVPGSATELDSSYSYEFFSEETDLNVGLPFGGYEGVKPKRGVLIPGQKKTIEPGFNLMRRWDGFAKIGLDGTLVEGWDKSIKMKADMSAISIRLSGGIFHLNLAENIAITLELTGKQILPGDYWLALARSNTVKKIRSLGVLPIGIQHHYCLLGYSEDGGITYPKLSPGDKRRLHFPELNCIHASDVGYAPGECGHAEGATTVQEGLDMICAAIPTYHVLKMSGGTGQEVNLGNQLPDKLRALVETQDGMPAANVQVRFKIGGGFSGVDKINNGASSSQTNLTVTTNANGEAFVYWELRGQAGLHNLQAELVNAPQGNACDVVFGAIATEIRNTDFPTVEKITWVDETQFKNDTRVYVDRVVQGFTVHFSDTIIEDLITQDVITLHMEYFDDHGEFIERVNQIVCGHIQTTDKSATFVPRKGFIENIFREFPDFDRIRGCAQEGIRFRIQVLGRFIFNSEGRPFDAFIPGVPAVESYYRPELVKPFEQPDTASGITVAKPDVMTDEMRELINGALRPMRSMAGRADRSKSAMIDFANGTNEAARMTGRAAEENASMGFGAEARADMLSDMRDALEDKIRPDIPGVRMVDKRRIALNYPKAGIGHPSDLKAWFYSSPNEWEWFENDKPKYETVVSVNVADKREMAFADFILEKWRDKILTAQPNIQDFEALKGLLRVKGVEAKALDRIAPLLSFAEGYIDEGADVPVIYANLEKDVSKVQRTQLMDDDQIARMIAYQPYWQNLEILQAHLNFTEKQVQMTKGRILFDGFKPKEAEDPGKVKKPEKQDFKKENAKKEGPKKEDIKNKDSMKKDIKKEDPKKDNSKRTRVSFNTASAVAIGKGLNIRSSPAKRIVTLRNQLLKKRGKPFASFEDLIRALREVKGSDNLIKQLMDAKDQLSFTAV